MNDRCPSCEHGREYHSEPGCWYAVTVGAPGKPLNCPCTLVDWLAPADAAVAAERATYAGIEYDEGAAAHLYDVLRNKEDRP